MDAKAISSRDVKKGDSLYNYVDVLNAMKPYT